MCLILEIRFEIVFGMRSGHHYYTPVSAEKSSPIFFLYQFWVYENVLYRISKKCPNLQVIVCEILFGCCFQQKFRVNKVEKLQKLICTRIPFREWGNAGGDCKRMGWVNNPYSCLKHASKCTSPVRSQGRTIFFSVKND